MEYHHLVDLHIHTDSSPDGEHAASLMCEYALRKGLRCIALTDHCECDAFHSGGYSVTSKISLFEAAKARSVFQGQLLVLLGVELGQPVLAPQVARQVAGKPSLDFVLASMHNLKDTPDFYYLDYSRPEYEPYALLERYFDALLETVQWGGFDSLAHVTYPLRYMNGRDHLDIRLDGFADRIDLLFRRLAQAGKALELNTSGLRTDWGQTMPDLALLKRFRALGGEYVTLGSDAHRVADVAGGIPQGLDMLREAGFRYVTIFQDRTAVPVLID